ncbi:S9 family peptidase [Bowmanella sp. JS7-9]|uniref:DPP IV N-terminal domain-containing protein n=1 Tax=Pseudobowmanella zhangzhouensis TaxID=1537679 RepID=A0ABW1XHE0_9ALTE|nr:S9 family peptidase [Bowmanella sp. JS7-9]TBX19886.1 peptidase S9 [Bowmanella sp. JS7-9]
MKKLLCLTALAASAQLSAETLSIERIFESPSLSGAAPQSLKISPDGKHITFLRGKQTDYNRLDLWEYNVSNGQTQLLFDSDTLSSGPEVLSDEEKARRERLRLSGSGIVSYSWSADSQALLFPLAGDVYYYQLEQKKLQKLLDTPEFETDIKLSPKGNYISYIREQNLYVKDIATGKERAITTKGGGNIKYGMAEFVVQEEFDRMTGYWWSPDESYIAFTKVDETPVDEVTRSEIYADRIDIIKQKYPAAGTNNVLIDIAVVDLATDNIRWVDLGKDKDIYIPRVKWMDNNHLTYQWLSRDQQTLQLRNVAMADMQQQVLIEEKANTWVNVQDELHFLRKAPQFIWASERDGFKHLYLYNNDGSLVKQLTQGDWVVDSLQAVDENNQRIYFTGRADTVLESHLYALDLTTGAQTRLTQRDGFHSIEFGKDASVYIDSSSTINSPTQVSLHKADGTQLTWLAENAVDDNHPLAPYQQQWVKPTFGSIKNDQGVDLYYRLYTPKKLEGKHPVIVFVYGGPHAQVVQNRWYGNRGLLFQYWVNKGYVVFSLDNRGSNYRGTAFENPIYQNMGSPEVEDQVTGVKFLRSLDFVDPERIGVYGHSYGGYMALMSMFKAGDYFQAGVSGAPVTDWALYDTAYTERYMGHPAKVGNAYEMSSVFPYAKDLKGKLFIYHGMADDNVLFKNSTRLYKHLQDMAIPYEMMDYPGKKHSLRGKQTGIHMYKTITSFFDRHFGMQ